MDLPKNILVPVDFGAPSLRACDRTVELARELGASVELLHVVEGPPYPLVPDAMDRLRQAGEKAMAAHADRLRPFVRDLTTRVEEGVPWRELTSAIGLGGSDLVVVGTHGRRGVARVALGSVAERLVRMSPVPVLTVPGHAFETREEAGRRLGVELTYREISSPAVVALSRGALPVADGVARALGGTLDVWGTAPVTFDGRSVGAMGEDELAYYDEPGFDPSIDRLEAERRARDEVREEITALRGTRSIGSVSDRLVVLVSDALAAAAPVMSAVRALTPLGASGFLLATPVAKHRALSDVRELVDEVVCLDTAILADVSGESYRQSAPPSFRESRAILGEWRGSAAPDPVAPLRAPVRHAP